MSVQGLMVEDEMVVMTALVGWMVVKPELTVLLGGAVILGWMEVMGVDLVVVLVRSSVMVTLLQVLQHMRWKSGREQWRFSASIRQSIERSP